MIFLSDVLTAKSNKELMKQKERTVSNHNHQERNQARSKNKKKIIQNSGWWMDENEWLNWKL
jgi:hypothetical protein